MPALSAETAAYLRRIQDSLVYGASTTPSRARLVLNNALEITANTPGAAGNAWTVQVTEPAGTSGIVVTPTGTSVVIALAVSSGVATAANTPAALAAAFNAAVTGLTARRLNNATTAFADPIAVQNLAGGADVSTTSMPAAQYLRAQDLSIVFDLLQDALTQTANLTATGGSATSVVDGAATFVANTQVGNVVTFAGNTTAALAGVTARVVSNNTTTLFFASGALPATPQAGDTYTIRGGCFDTLIDSLREGAARGNNPVGNLYGDANVVYDALVRGITQLGGTVAEPTLWSGVTGTGSTSSWIELNTRGGSLRPGQFKGLKLTVTGLGSRIIKNGDETAVEVAPAFGSAPGSGVAATITVAADSQDAVIYSVHPGAQPGDNARLANLLSQLEARVVAFVLPT